MSMAHGVELRVPFLDHPLVELLATVPANIKFRNGELKRAANAVFGSASGGHSESQGQDGFPRATADLAPKEGGRAREFVQDVFRQSTRQRPETPFKPGFNPDALISGASVFNRNLWAFLSLELWQQHFHDVHQPYKA